MVARPDTAVNAHVPALADDPGVRPVRWELPAVAFRPELRDVDLLFAGPGDASHHQETLRL